MNKTHLSLLSCLLLSGCGTVFGGTTQNITIASNVKGVSIFDGGMRLCQTPCTFQVRRKRGEKHLIAKKKGYDDARIILGTSINVFTIGNIFCTYGFTTDALTDALWEYAPHSYYVNMMRNEKELRKEELIKKEIRRFILSNYDALRAEARSGRGEHITSLASLSGLDNEDIRQMCADATSAVLLAETVTERYEEEKGGDHSFSKLADGEN